MTGWERTSNTAFIFLHQRESAAGAVHFVDLSKGPMLLLGNPFAKCLFSLLNTGDKYSKVRSLDFIDFIAEKLILVLQSVTQKKPQEWLFAQGHTEGKRNNELIY